MEARAAEIRGSWAAGDAEGLARQLGQLKLELARRGSLLATSGEDAAVAQLVAEYSMLLAAQRGDWALMERAYQQVRPFHDARSSSSSSTSSSSSSSSSSNLGGELRLPLAGMHLLRLVVLNQAGAFHSELERLPAADREDPCVRFATDMEAALLVGAYSRVFAIVEQRGLPHPTYKALVQHLVDARVRDELIAASESAYASMRVDDACKLFRFASADELLAYGKPRGWVLEAGGLRFHAERRVAAANIDAQLLVAQTLNYAKELERIV